MAKSKFCETSVTTLTFYFLVLAHVSPKKQRASAPIESSVLFVLNLIFHFARQVAVCVCVCLGDNRTVSDFKFNKTLKAAVCNSKIGKLRQKYLKQRKKATAAQMLAFLC